ncbi:MAG: hypothetical protein EB145_16055, partial [Proteobacteria bacterium]|nr:hypothetical protein [Pseudomonadota bacterium]
KDGADLKIITRTDIVSLADILQGKSGITKVGGAVKESVDVAGGQFGWQAVNFSGGDFMLVITIQKSGIIVTSA